MLPSAALSILVVLAGAETSARVGSAAAPRIVVPSITSSGELPKGTTEIVTELLLEALLNRHGVKALGPSDVREILTAEQQKALLGCDQDACMAELAGAMGADKLIAGSVGKLGSLYVVTLKLIDAGKATVVARASTRVDKVEALVDAVGPLTDQLLGRAPARGQQPLAPALQPAAPPKPVQVLEPTEYCDRVKAHARALQDKPYAAGAVAERRFLLEDLMHTPFKQQFDRKRSCIWEWDGRVRSSLRRDWLGARRPGQALDARHRLQEWGELTRLLKLLEEAYETGLEKEKNGVGQRPSELPFEVAPVVPWQPGQGRETVKFLRAFKQAQKTVGKAIEAARAGKQKRFERLYTADDPQRSRTSPHYVYEQLQGYLKSGYSLDPCPVFVLSRGEFQRKVERLEREGLMVGCMRRHKDDFVTTDDIYLVQGPTGWRIDRW